MFECHLKKILLGSIAVFTFLGSAVEATAASVFDMKKQAKELNEMMTDITLIPIEKIGSDHQPTVNFLGDKVAWEKYLKKRKGKKLIGEPRHGIYFFAGNMGTQRVVGTAPIGSKEPPFRIAIKDRKGFQNDEARSLLIRRIVKGTVISLYDSPSKKKSSRMKDDFAVIEVLETIKNMSLCISSFEQNIVGRIPKVAQKYMIKEARKAARKKLGFPDSQPIPVEKLGLPDWIGKRSPIFRVIFSRVNKSLIRDPAQPFITILKLGLGGCESTGLTLLDLEKADQKTLAMKLLIHYGTRLDGKLSFVETAPSKKCRTVYPYDLCFYEDYGCKGDLKGWFYSREDLTINCKKSDRCQNDEVKSLKIMPWARPGTRIFLYDDPDGGHGDDWAEIVLRKRKAIRTSPTVLSGFERSRTKRSFIVNAHRHNGLDGKVSRVKVLPSSK